MVSDKHYLHFCKLFYTEARCIFGHLVELMYVIFLFIMLTFDARITTLVGSAEIVRSFCGSQPRDCKDIHAPNMY
jgi:hypothetical protein